MVTLPNELLVNIIEFTDQASLVPFLFVCKFTFQLVRTRVYKRVIFPKDIQPNQVISFCQLYGNAVETMKLPQARYFPTEMYSFILLHCPRLDFLQSTIYPKQLNKCLSSDKATCFMVTDIPLLEIDSAYHNITHFNCCSSYFIFPNEFISDSNPTLTQISHYYHHPGALSNAILPTFGSDLLALTLNPYDVLTSTVSRLIVAKCPRLRYLVVPSVKAEGLWMLLRWCHTLATIIVGYDPNLDGEEDDLDFARRSFIDIENKRAVETIQQHKRVWCIHLNENVDQRLSWHIGIIPKS